MTQSIVKHGLSAKVEYWDGVVPKLQLVWPNQQLPQHSIWFFDQECCEFVRDDDGYTEGDTGVFFLS